MNEDAKAKLEDFGLLARGLTTRDKNATNGACRASLTERSKGHRYERDFGLWDFTAESYCGTQYGADDHGAVKFQ